ncbi:DUF983 domain-containing protein [Marinoscillum furvescens]|nr:DUF983 domain-containing protein [Marinoscillum furvescens]
MFKHSPVNLKGFGAMHRYCPSCGHQFEQEPGFYYGAMYVSYAVSVGVFLVTSLLVYLLFNNPSVTAYVIAVGVVSALLYPLNFRYSRIFFTYLFSGVKYEPNRKE